MSSQGLPHRRARCLGARLDLLVALALAATPLAACGGDDDGDAGAGRDGGAPDGAPEDGPMDAPRWVCGDGRRQGPETCDDGNRVAEECPYGMTACMVCGAECVLEQGAVSYCGDGVLQDAEGETCDDGPASSDGWALGSHCNASCDGPGRFCEDGTLDPEEECEGPGSPCALGGGCGTSCVCDFTACAAIASPAVVGSVGLPAAVVRLHLAYDRVHAVVEGDATQLVDVSDPARPVVRGTFEPGFRPLDAFATRRALHVVGQGLVLADVRAPATPIRLGAGLGDGAWSSVTVDGAFAYVADDAGAFAIASLANPRAPATLASEAGFSTRVSDLEASGDTVYLVTNDGPGDTARSGLRVVDVSDRTAPRIVGRYETPGDPRGLVVAGGRAYVADGDDAGLTIVDVSRATAPTLAGSLPGAGRGTNDVAVAGGFAVLATTRGLEIVDVTDPARPASVATLALPAAFAVEARGRYAFSGHADGALRVVRLCPVVP